MLKLKLRRLPSSTVGIYGPGKNIMPSRALLLHPDAAASFLAYESEVGGLVYSDIYRSAESSLNAIKTKQGVQPPGFSGHNYGLALDVAVNETLKRRGWTYPQLLAFMESKGWYCFRRDGKRGMEDWHMNYLGTGDFARQTLSSLVPGQWSKAAEAVIVANYGPALSLSHLDIQKCLARLKVYRGTLDGNIGPLSMEAIRTFCRGWRISVETGPRFQRTLAFVAADYDIEELPASQLVS
jgi:hypothetical protein